MATASGDAKPSFAERLILLLDRIEYRRAESDADKEAIYRLRYDAYLREGSIKPDAGQRLKDALDDTDNVWPVGVFLDGRLVGSIRIHVADREHPISPASQWFPDLIGPELAAGKVIVEPTRLVADFETARAVPELAYLIVRVGVMAGWHFNADIITATARPEHQAFYKRVFGFRAECPPRVHPPFEKSFGIMFLRDLWRLEQAANRFPCFHSTAEERAMLFDRDMPERAPGRRRSTISEEAAAGIGQAA